ncbi:lipid II flippase MurJ [Neobacillus sp. SAB-20_R2A]|uniref:lipid II flippase MurJ n=1 Tax=Neobacillus sp. SAB-20_R2A TaxID=3120519 RepID=UPI003C6E08E3
MFSSLMKRSNFKQAVVVIFLFDIFVRVIQFLRELAFSTFYGFSKVTDAFNFTVNILGTPLNLIADALLVGIIPSLNKKESMQEKTNYVFSLMIAFTSIITVLFIGYFSFFSYFMKLLAPGFESDTLTLTFKFSILYSGIGLLLVLNRIIDNFFRSEKIFGLANFTNLVSSVISILILFLLYKQTSLAITIGMLVGTILSFAILFSRLPLKKMTCFDRDAVVLIKNSLPLLISGGLGVINTFVDKSFATLFASGTLTILSYSNMIVLLISSVITNAISSASYSFVASEIANNEFKKVQARVSQINFFFLFIYSLICLLYIILGEFFLKLLFHRGNISLTDIDMLYRLTLIFIPMTIFSSTGSIVLQVFYSFNNLKVTTIINSMCVLLNILLNFLFIKKFGVYTLAGSTLISSIAATLINSYFLYKKYQIWALDFRMILFASFITVFTISCLILDDLWLQLIILLGLMLVFVIIFNKESKEIKTLFKGYVLRK